MKKDTPQKIGSAYDPIETHTADARRRCEDWKMREQERLAMIRIIVILGIMWTLFIGAALIYKLISS
jgi:hypothetical protein